MQRQTILLIICFLASSFSWADSTNSDEIVVGMADGPVYYDSPFLKGRIWSGKGSAQLTGLNKRQLEDANREMKFLDEFSRDTGVWNRLSEVERKQVTRLRQIMHHGTKVAELLIQGDAKLKLANVSDGADSFMPRASMKKAFLREPSISALASNFAFFSKIDKVIREAGIRVFNFSTNWDSAENLQNARQWLGLPRWLFHYSQLKRNSTQWAESQQIDFLNLVRSHRETIFVVSAGNEGKWLGEPSISISKIREPNVLVVGAVGLDGQWRPWSNYGDPHVDIAALGENYVANVPASEATTFSRGTSLSAPLVAHRLARILARNPGFSSQQAIKELYSQHVDRKSELSLYVSEGRVLKIDKEEAIKVSASGKFWKLESCELNFQETVIRNIR